ncbi:MAG: LamG-like jellyroll fold domain-containing protein [Candidatus Magasanikbacteria bacterium]
MKSLKNYLNRFVSDESGQSLIEILIALSIGAILIGAASSAVVLVLQSGETSQRQQTATSLAQSYLQKVRTLARSDWSSIYDLKKTSSTKYFLEASSSQTMAVEGVEGVLGNDIRGGLVGYWQLDEATSSVSFDDTSKENNGSYINKPSRPTSSNCAAGRCIDFNGTDERAEISDDSSLDFVDGDDFTITGWFRRDSFSSDDALVAKMENVFGSGSGYGIAIGGSDDKMEFRVGDGTDSFQLESSSVFDSSEWHHFAVVWDDDSTSTTEIYIDGEDDNAVRSGTQSSVGDVSNSEELHLASESDDGIHFDGALDDIRVYNTKLSSKDIENLHNSPVFKRYFFVNNVCRTDGSSYALRGAAPCGAGEKKDPSTQLINTAVQWSSEGKVELDSYIIRWSNEVYQQTDWSGQVGVEGPVEDSTNDFTTSTNVVTSTGKIKVQLP